MTDGQGSVRRPGERRIARERLVAIVAHVFEAAGSSRDEAHLIATYLIEANLVGHDSHGLMRAARYVDLKRAGKVFPNRHVEIVSGKGASVLLDGRFGYGQVIGSEAMTIGADRAARHGFAVVALRNAGHLGRIGAWAELLAHKGLVSLHFVNSSGFGILVAPHGGSDRRLSSNPIAAGVPLAGRPHLILDIATSAVAEGKIQVARNRGEQLQPGEMLDGKGRPTTDPDAFYGNPPGAILPFGGHKGSGLSILCEVLAGSLTGGFASNPGSPTAGQIVNNMFSLIVDPESFVGNAFFGKDVASLTDWVRASPPREPGGGVLLPGEIEARTRREREAHGIPVDDQTWATFLATAASLGVDAGS